LEKLGVEIVEMKNSKENSRCCGGGGGILMTDQDLSGAIARKRIKEAIETGWTYLLLLAQHVNKS